MVTQTKNTRRRSFPTVEKLNRPAGKKALQDGLKQVGLLAVVDADQANSQREIAAQLGVAPSLVVSLVDQLASIGAVRRTRSRTDRRVQVVEITNEGRQLLRLATDAAKKLDVELHKHLSPADLQALNRLLPTLLRASSVAAGNRP